MAKDKKGKKIDPAKKEAAALRKAQKADIEAWKARHKSEHRGERDYAEDLWLKGERYPSLVTCMSMDAPTETQFDVPVQKRTAKDPQRASTLPRSGRQK